MIKTIKLLDKAFLDMHGHLVQLRVLSLPDDVKMPVKLSVEQVAVAHDAIKTALVEIQGTDAKQFRKIDPRRLRKLARYARDTNRSLSRFADAGLAQPKHQTLHDAVGRASSLANRVMMIYGYHSAGDGGVEVLVCGPHGGGGGKDE